MKKIKTLLAVFVIVLLCSSFASAGLWDSITGKLSLKNLLGINSDENQNQLEVNDLPTAEPNEDDEEPSTGLVFSIYYKSNGQKIHYMDFSSPEANFMTVNTNLGQLVTSAVMVDSLLEIDMETSNEAIQTQWGIQDNEFNALGELPSEIEYRELRAIVDNAEIGNGLSEENIELPSGIEIKTPATFGAQDKVKMLAVPANDNPATGTFWLEFENTCNHLNSIGLGDKSCIRLQTAKQDGFLLGDVETKEVYIVIHGEDDEEGWGEVLCTDTDGGENVFELGSCIDAAVWDQDTCYSASTVAERYCLDINNCGVKNIPCPSGLACEGGVCVEEDIQEFPRCDNKLDDDNDGFMDMDDATCNNCIDNDGGMDIYTASMASVDLGPDFPHVAYADSCYEGTLREGVCFEDGTHFIEIICPEGSLCLQGACVTEADIMDDAASTYVMNYGEWYAADGELNQILAKKTAIRRLAENIAVTKKGMAISSQDAAVEDLVEINNKKVGFLAKLFGKK